MAIYKISRVSGVSPETFNRDFIETGTPAILTDATRDWPAILRWNREYLQNQNGELNVSLRSIDPQKPSKHTRTLETSLANYFKQMNAAASDDPYLAELPLKSVFPALLDDIGTLPYCSGSAEDLSVMLSCHSYAPLHYHAASEALSHQIVGKRRFLLFPPSETIHLDPRAPVGPLPNFARRHFREEEAALGPEKVFDAPLEPGDTLFIPRHWWHTVFANGELSVLLVRFFEYPHPTTPQNEVTRRIETLRQANIEAISFYERSFSSARTEAERRFCLQHLYPLYKQVPDDKRERTFLAKAIKDFPSPSTEHSQIEYRLKELAKNGSPDDI